MSTEKTVLTSFDTWKKFLGDRVQQAEKMGMNEETINKLAYEIGDFLDEIGRAHV